MVTIGTYCEIPNQEKACQENQRQDMLPSYLTCPGILPLGIIVQNDFLWESGQGGSSIGVGGIVMRATGRVTAVAEAAPTQTASLDRASSAPTCFSIDRRRSWSFVGSVE